MGHFDVNVIENNTRRCVLNISSKNDNGTFITGGYVCVSGTAPGDGSPAQTVSLVTGYRTHNDGGTLTKVYTNRVPCKKITQVIYGHGGAGSGQSDLYAVSGDGNVVGSVQHLATYTGSGSITYDPPLTTDLNCARPNYYLERSNHDGTFYIILRPDDDI